MRIASRGGVGLVAGVALGLVGLVGPGRVQAGELKLYHGPKMTQGQKREWATAGGEKVIALPVYVSELDSHNTGPTVNGNPSYVGFVVMGARQKERFDGSGINYTWSQKNFGLQQKQICQYHATENNWTAFNSQETYDFFGELDAIGADPGKYMFYVWREFGYGASLDKIWYQYEVDYLPPNGLGGIKVRFVNDENKPVSGTVTIASDGGEATYLYNGAPVWSAGVGSDGFMSLGDLRSGKRYIARCRVTATNQIVNIAFAVPTPSSDDEDEPIPPHPWLKYEIRVVSTDSSPQINYLGLDPASAGGGGGAAGSSYDGPKADAPFFTTGWWQNLFSSLFTPSSTSVENWRQFRQDVSSWGPFGVVNQVRDGWDSASESSQQSLVEQQSISLAGEQVHWTVDWRPESEGGNWLGTIRASIRATFGLALWGFFIFGAFLRWVRPQVTV